MRMVIALALVVLFVTPAVAERIGDPASSPALKGFVFESADDGESELLTHPFDAVAPYWTGHPETMEGEPTASVSMRPEGDVMIVDLRKEGLLDDAVSGEHYRAVVVSRPDGGWFTIELGRRIQCARGPMAGKWGINACP